ncbi:unnamed protein product [Porites evermanni]|uniref:MADF domain-containing protein n=1 Tax=Porites evermanni TaxID=104178 RepID=A0ABN8S7R8_9CNID|nr:unnamed protein product [Porites evermanni]
MAGDISTAEQEPVQKKSSKSRYFVWTEDHDVLMLHEAVTSEPYNFKPKSSDRGKVWESIAAYLNSLKTPEFRVTARRIYGPCLHICMGKKAALAVCRDLLVHHKQSTDCR